MNNEALENYIFEHNGCIIHYWMTGPEQGPLVIFVHGVGVDHHMFDAQISDLARICRVLVWDLRGHGQSQPKGQAFSIRVAAEDLLALLQHVDYSKAILVGVSIGGNIALMASALAPDSITALALVGACNQWLPLSLWSRICLQAVIFYVHFLPTPLLQKIFTFLASTRSEVRTYINHIWSQMPKKDFVEIWEAFLYQKRHTQTHQCPTPRPILLVCGRYDITANYKRQWDSWECATGYLHHVTVPSAGHVANNDNPAFFNRVLIEYVNQFAELGKDTLKLREVESAPKPVRK